MTAHDGRMATRWRSPAVGRWRSRVRSETASRSRRARRTALVVLLPDPETRTTGRARVSNASGSVDLAAQRDSTRVDGESALRAPSRKMSEADVQRVFGAALAALPPAPRHFTLYFRFESDALTDESRALVPEILRTVKERAGPGSRRRRAHGHDGDAADEPRARVEAGDDRPRYPRRGGPRRLRPSK